MSDDNVKVAEEVLLPPKTRILQSMDPSEEGNNITRDVKTSFREDLNPRYTFPTTLHDYLHRSTALDPRFKSLSHLDLALCPKTYSTMISSL